MEMTQRALTVIGGGKGLGDENLRRWLECYIKEHEHLTTTELSRSDHIGASRSALDAYLAGTYFLSKEMGGLGKDAENTNWKIESDHIATSVEGTVRHGYRNTFIETRSWHQFQHACILP